MAKLRISNSSTMYIDGIDKPIRVSDHKQKKKFNNDNYHQVIISTERLNATNALLGYVALQLLGKEARNE